MIKKKPSWMIRLGYTSKHIIRKSAGAILPPPSHPHCHQLWGHGHILPACDVTAAISIATSSGSIAAVCDIARALDAQHYPQLHASNTCRPILSIPCVWTGHCVPSWEHYPTCQQMKIFPPCTFLSPMTRQSENSNSFVFDLCADPLCIIQPGI